MNPPSAPTLVSEAVHGLADRFARLARLAPSDAEIAAREAKILEDRAQLAREEAERAWRRYVPEEYRFTNEADPRLDPVARRFCAAWEATSRRGVLLSGKSGLGKTRCLTLALRRAMEAGRTVRWLRHIELADAATNEHKPGLDQRAKDAAGLLLYEAEHVGVLLLDDLGKGSSSERAIEALANIVEIRTAAGRPILCTMQGGSDWLEARLKPDRGPAIVRRLGEFCDRPDEALPRDFALDVPQAA